jgi:hypothetical protein
MGRDSEPPAGGIFVAIPVEPVDNPAVTPTDAIDRVPSGRVDLETACCSD